MRFGEVRAPALALVHGLIRVVLGGIFGTGFAFVLVLILGLTGDEVFRTFAAVAEADPLFRAAPLAAIIVAASLGTGYALLLAAERYAARRGLREQARATPGIVPVLAQRNAATEPPSGPLQFLAGALVVLGGLPFVVAGLMLLGDPAAGDEPVVWIVTGTTGLACLVGIILWRIGGRIAAAWPDSIADLQQDWSVRIPRAVEHERRMRQAATLDLGVPPNGSARDRLIRWTSAWMGLALTLGTGAFFAGVFLRQPCRECEPITWGDRVESGIDLLVLFGAGAVLLVIALSAVGWVFATVARFGAERAWRRWADAGGIRTVDDERLRPLLAEQSAAERTAQTLGGVASMAVTFGVGILLADWQGADAGTVLLAGAAIGVVAVLVAVLGEERARRTREAVREVTFPGDLDHPQAEAD